MIGHKKYLELTQFLLDNLPKLEVGGPQLEYGEPEQPGGHFSYLRIRRMPTVGGIQFRLCELYQGREGSGVYSDNLDRIVEQAMDLVNRYHHPTRMTIVLGIKKDLLRELSWFYTPVDKDAKPQPRVDDFSLPGEVVIDLTQDLNLS